MKPSKKAVMRASRMWVKLCEQNGKIGLQGMISAMLLAAMEPKETCPCAEGSIDGKAHAQYGLIRLEEG